MTKTACAPAPPATEPVPADDAVLDEDGLVEEDLLLEDVSIDGMCGVY
jgi:mycofactocin precursor